MRYAIVTGLAGLLIAGCREAPMQPKPPPSATMLAAISAASLAPCTSHWASGVDGDWNDPTMWSPASVPGQNDSACIDAAGTYTVTLSQNAGVDALTVGGVGSVPTLRFDTPNLHDLRAITGIRVRAGAKLAMKGCARFIAAPLGALLIEGTLSVNLACGGLQADIRADTIDNRGTLDLRSVTFLFGASRLANSGAIVVASNAEATVALNPGGDIRIQGGSITGSSAFTIFGGSTPSDTTRLTWSGGILADRSDTTAAIVAIYGTSLVLGTTGLSGSLDVVATSFLGVRPNADVTGDVGGNVRLRLIAGTEGTFTLRSNSGGPLVNRGRIDVHGDDPAFTPPPGTPSLITAAAGMVNRGLLRFVSGRMDMDADSLVNFGTLQLDTTARFTSNQHVLRNRGSITVAAGTSLVVDSGAIYHGEPSGTMTGQLRIDDGTLRGRGSVGDVVSVSSQIEPGDSIGTLRLSSLTLDQVSSLKIDVAGVTPGSFDQLVVAGNVVYGGAALDVRTLAPFDGGSCGQVVPFLLDHSTAPRGAFVKKTGLSPAPLRAWRTYNPADTLALVGFNPVVQTFATPTVMAVAEGAPSSSYSVCIRSAPTATVTISQSFDASQLTLSGAARFTPADWSPPRTVTVAAVNDALIEAPRTESVLHTVTSADPSYNNQPLAGLTVGVADDDGNADLALTLTQGPPPLTVGQTFDVVFQVANAGPTLSTGSTFTVPPIPGIAFVSSTGATCRRSLTTGLTCDVVGVAGGAAVSFTITARATAVGVFGIPMSLTGHQRDPNLANNALVRNVTVN